MHSVKIARLFSVPIIIKLTIECAFFPLCRNIAVRFHEARNFRAMNYAAHGTDVEIDLKLIFTHKKLTIF